MPLPQKDALLAAAARKDWWAVLGLPRGRSLTAAEARKLRAAVHPDKGGDAEVAAVVNAAIDSVLAAEPSSSSSSSSSEYFPDWLARMRREQDEWLARIRRQQEEWLANMRREQDERRRKAREDAAQMSREREIRRLAEERLRWQQRRDQIYQEREQDRKRRRTECQRVRRAAAAATRQEPDAEAIKAAIRARVEACSVQDASPVQDIKSALGMQQRDLVAAGLTSGAARKQRGSGKDRVYYFEFEGNPIKVRAAAAEEPQSI